MDQQKDNLEEFFRESFEKFNSEVPAEEWDTPSEKVWSGIESGVAGTIYSPLPAWIKPGVLIFLLSFAGILLFFLIFQNKKLNDRLNEQEKTIATLREQLENPKNSATANISETQPKIPTSDFSKEKEGTETSSVQKTRISPSIAAKKQITDQNIKDKIAPLQEYSTKAHSDKEENTVELHFSPVQPATNLSFTEKEDWADLKPIQRLSPEVTPIPAGIPLRTPADLTPSGSASNGRFYVGAYISPNYTSRSLQTSGARTRPLFASKETNSIVPEYGLKAGWRIHKNFSLETGLGHYSIAQRSTQLFRIFYNPELEQQSQGGDYVATYKLDVPSSLGSSKVDLEMNRTEDTRVIPGEAFIVMLKNRQELSFISIPVTGAYHFTSGRFDMSIRGGLALNILNTKTFRTVARSRFSALRAGNVRVRSALDEANSITTDFVLGLGIGYHLTPAISLRFDPTYRRNVKPLITTTDFQTNSFALGIHTGIFYTF